MNKRNWSIVWIQQQLRTRQWSLQQIYGGKYEQKGWTEQLSVNKERAKLNIERRRIIWKRAWTSRTWGDDSIAMRIW